MSTNTYEKNVLSHNKLRLRGLPYVEGSWESPDWQWDIFAGNPQIVVWSKHPAELNKINEATGKPLHNTPIKGATSLPRLLSVFHQLRRLYGKHEPSTYVLKLKTVERDEAGQPIRGKRKVAAKLLYGRHPEGYLFFELRQPGRPNLPFPFMDDSWHEQERDNGEVPLAELSEDICEGHLSLVEEMYKRLFHDKFDPDFKPAHLRNQQTGKESPPQYNEASPELEKEVTPGATDGW